MEWTASVPLALALLHVALAHDEASVTEAAGVVSLAVAMQALSACDLHAVSVAFSAPMVFALAWGVANEALHVSSVLRDNPTRAADEARWRAIQRRHNAASWATLVRLRAQKRE